MLATIPYFDVPIVHLGPIVLDSWAALVALGFIVGLEVTRARGIRMGLDVRDVVDGVVVTVGMGFLVGHLVHVLAYHPEQLDEQGIMALVRVWAGFSSTGGFIGAIIGSVVFFKLVRRRPFWPHADAMAFGFPFGWLFGRLGCFSAHDHIGRRTDFFLAVDFPNLAWTHGPGPRHDLGLYEALWTMAIAAVFFALRNRPVRPGFFTALFATLYAPVRFLLDFLRAEDIEGADVRWAGLTPAQYGMILMFLAGLTVAWRLRHAPAEAPGEDAPDGEPAEAGAGEDAPGAEAPETPSGRDAPEAEASDDASA